MPLPWFGTTLHQIYTPKPTLELELHRKLGKLYGLVSREHRHGANSDTSH